MLGSRSTNTLRGNVNKNMKVKGTFLVDYVRVIRSDRSKNWDRWLEPEDWEIINSQILATSWYSYTVFRRIAYAVFKEAANADPKIAFQFGRHTMNTLLKTYKRALRKKDPAGCAEGFTRIKNYIFQEDDSDFRIEDLGPNSMKYRIIKPSAEDDMYRIVAISYTIAGCLAELFDRVGIDIKTYSVTQSDGHCDILLTW